jgi:hypothetical protein
MGGVTKTVDDRREPRLTHQNHKDSPYQQRCRGCVTHGEDGVLLDGDGRDNGEREIVLRGTGRIEGCVCGEKREREREWRERRGGCVGKSKVMKGIII